MRSVTWLVSPITPDDLPIIFAIENQSPSPWTMSQLEGELFCSQGLQLAYRHRDNIRVVGLIMGRAVNDETEILKINTNPEDRRQGIACHLISEFIKLVKEKGGQKMSSGTALCQHSGQTPLLKV